MSLTSALSNARNALAVRSAETDIVSRNVAGANDPGYTRKSASVVTTDGGGVRVAGVTRASNDALFTSMLKASSGSAASSALLDGVNQLQQTVDPSLGDATPAGRIGALTDALTQAAASPSDQLLAQNAVSAAQDVAQVLHDASTTVQGVRKSADADIVSSVNIINTLLGQFQTLNSRIVSGTAVGKDVTSDLDARDQIVSQLSQEIGVRTTTRAGNDMQIYTDGGATLFDTTARTVSVKPTTSFDASTNGQPVMIDGMPATGPNAVMGIKSGRLFGLTQVRDQIAPAYQGQLDEMARGLINAYSETNAAGDPASARAGLFRNGASTALPTGLTPGLAASIAVAPTVDTKQGGNPFLLRDGGISNPSDPTYKLNATSAASFSDRLLALSTAAGTTQSFDPSVGGPAQGSLTLYASSSVGWIEGQRQTASTDSDQKSAFLDRAQQALSSATGVSIDDEMSKMLDLERAYQGSAKLISAVDNMMQALLQAAG
jgi:flagellar hook-associated protein 1 FlgK